MMRGTMDYQAKCLATDALRFPTTHWSAVMAAKDQATEALDRLCKAYQSPIAAYLSRFTRNPHDREDLLQGFLAHLNRPTTLSRMDRELGSFRSFIKKSLSNYVLGQSETAEAKRRGGGSLTVSLDDGDNGVAERMTSEGLSPDQAFDRHWALNVVELASRRLQVELKAAGRGELWEGLLPMLYQDSDRARYRELSRNLGMSEEALRRACLRLRLRFRGLIVEELKTTLPEHASVEGELRYLMVAIAGEPRW